MTSETRLTDAEIAELLDLEAKATPGEWIEGGSGNSRIYGADGCGPEISGIIANFARFRDRAFIARARNSLRRALRELMERREAESAQKTAARGSVSTHRYSPHRRYPWFCGECGYPEHERLKHHPVDAESGKENADDRP